MGHFEQVEEAWRLCEAVAALARSEGRPVDPAEAWERVFRPSGLVDQAATPHDDGAPHRIFLHGPYGLRYRPEDGAWLPFRHGAVDLKNV